MSRYSINPARLLDRPWRCGHPFRPHRGRCRKVVMSILFLVLSVVIGGYAYLTDSDRVRMMAQGYLSHLLGGRVEVGRATLSIFQGLRLDDVKVHVDRDPSKPDSLLFSAQSFIVNYDPRKLIAGQLEATEIIAQKPHVFLTLTQTAREDRWNYHRLHQPPPAPSTSPKTAPHKIALPEILLRNAMIEISEVKAGHRVTTGSMAIDGQLSPAGDGEHYQFEMQTRGMSLGPYASGSVSVDSGELTAHLRNVQFGDDMRRMFPADLRGWWERHELAGRIESVDVSYAPPFGEAPPKFSIETTVKGVTLAVRREEWSGQQDVDRWQRTRDAISLLRGPYHVAGYSARRSFEASASAAGDEPPGPAAPGQGPGPAPSLEPRSPVETMLSMVDTSPIWLREVSGTFVFTQDAIDVKDLLVRVGAGDANDPGKTNSLRVRGHMDGYRPDAPLRLAISSSDPRGLYFPAKPKFLDSLPREVRQVYEDLRPEGTCRVTAGLSRAVPGAAPQVSVQVDVVDAKFLFHQFRYPFRGASGTIAFGRDPFTGRDYVNVINMHGHGMIGGVNEHATVTVSGRVGPLGPDYPEPGFNLRATGRHISSEPRLLAAMPPEVRQALRIFDAPGNGEFPQFKGNFACSIVRAAGPGKRMTFDTDVELEDAAGRLVGFPYPCRGVHGNLEVRDGYVDIHNVVIPNGNASALVNGRVRWADERGHGQPLDMKVQLSARGLPIDNDLLGAMPPEQGAWLKKLGIGGRLDVDGRVFTVLPADWRSHIIPGRKPVDPPVQYDLAIAARDGTIWPADGLFCVSAVAGRLHLTNSRLDILEARGRREDADISASGWLTFAGPRAPKMALHVAAANLAVDRALYALLPAEGRKSWDEVQPSGTVDVDIQYGGTLGSAPLAAVASASPTVELPAPQDQPDFRAVLKPRKLSVKVKTAPYPLTFNAGTVTIRPGGAVLKDMVGTHKRARLVVSGHGTMGPAPVWELALHGERFRADADFRRAMPPTLLAIVDGLKLGGDVGFDFPRLVYRGSGSAAADPDIDVAGTLTLNRGSIDAGMLLTDIAGGMNFSVATRQGKVDSFNGSLAFNSLKLGGRPVIDLKLDLVQPSGKADLHIDNIRAKVAGGELGGAVLLTFPDQGASRYSMNMVVRNADVKQLTGETDQDIRGELTASLALEGAWGGDPRQRRGRGDVVVVGKQLYRMPLMLGLMQITNLSLPIGQPFTRGTARYTVDGTRVNFDQMDLRSDNMMMTGTGYLDFATRQVRMTMTTDNPSGFKVPFISDLWQGARQELLKINIRGTVQEPKVQPTSLNLVSTTIDEVFKGDGPRK